MTDAEIRALVQTATEEAVRPHRRALLALVMVLAGRRIVPGDQLADDLANVATLWRTAGAQDEDLSALNEMRSLLLEMPDRMFG